MPLLSVAWTTVTRCAIRHHRRTNALPAVNSERCRDGHQAMWLYLACALPAALASCEAARRVQDCDSRPPVLARQRSGLPGRRLSARHQRPCQTVAFRRHSNTRCLSDAQQFSRQDLCRCRITRLEQSAAQSQTMWAVIRPVQTFLFGQWGHGAVWTVVTAPNRNILTYLLTYLNTKQ